MKDKPRIVGLVLAAGTSSRMGVRNKLTTPYQGRPLLSHCLEQAQRSALCDLVVVTGHEKTAVAALVPSPMRRVHNPAFATGMASSLVAGVQSIADQEFHGAMVLLGDMPLVTSEHINALLNRFRTDGEGSIVVAADGPRLGNPVVFARCYFDALIQLTGDQGAKPVIKEHESRVVLVDIGEAAHRDFDTPDAFN
ncbi:MAG: nucleotidyltransferase family protein [Pseudomonadota bacterium]